MSDLKVRLRNYRAFADTGLVPVRPLTFLIGENSTGKTSFLAALNLLLNLKTNSEELSLNRPPFDLGSFEQIAHRSKSGTTAGSFHFEMERWIDFSSKEARQNEVSLFGLMDEHEKDLDGLEKCALKIFFSNSFGAVSPNKVDFIFRNAKISFSLHRKLEAVIYIDRQQHELVTSNAPHNYSQMGIHLISMIVSGLYFNKPDKDDAIHAIVVKSFSALSTFLSTLPAQTIATAPVRSTPERTYTESEVTESVDGRNTPYRLRRAKISNAAAWKEIKGGLTKFGKLTGLFTQIDIAKLTRDLAGPFKVNLKIGGRTGTIADVGYGVSQTLPLVTNLIEADESSAFLFQQPEVHLHPKAQAGVGTYLSQFANSHPTAKIIVETHSDFILDRVRTEIRRGKLDSESVCILYFESLSDQVKCHPIMIDKMGNLINPPECYRDFFIREQAASIGIDL